MWIAWNTASWPCGRPGPSRRRRRTHARTEPIRGRRGRDIGDVHVGWQLLLPGAEQRLPGARMRDRRSRTPRPPRSCRCAAPTAGRRGSRRNRCQSPDPGSRRRAAVAPVVAALAAPRSTSGPAVVSPQHRQRLRAGRRGGPPGPRHWACCLQAWRRYRRVRPRSGCCRRPGAGPAAGATTTGVGLVGGFHRGGSMAKSREGISGASRAIARSAGWRCAGCRRGCGPPTREPLFDDQCRQRPLMPPAQREIARALQPGRGSAALVIAGFHLRRHPVRVRRRTQAISSIVALVARMPSSWMARNRSSWVHAQRAGIALFFKRVGKCVVRRLNTAGT